MADNQVEFEIVARLESVERGLKKIESESEKTGQKLDKEIGSGFGKRMGVSWAGLAKAATVAGAAMVAGLAYGLKKGIDAAIVQENAVNKLNQALASAGSYSLEASKSMQALASQIQRTTTTGDEAALNYIALARNFARSNEEAKKLTLAALDLSAATGISTESAIKNLGKSLGGLSGELGESIAGIRTLTAEQLKAGAAIDLVAKRFAGAAAAETNTFSGAIKQAKNAFGDMLEEIGNLVIKSPSVVAAIKFIKEQFQILTAQLGSFAAQGDPFRSILLGGANVAKFFTYVLGPAIEIIIGAFKNAGIVLGGFASSLVSFFSGEFRQAAETLKTMAVDAFTNTVDTFSFSGTKAAVGFIDGFKDAVANAAPVVKEVVNSKLVQPVNEAVAGITFDAFATAFTSTANKIQMSALSLATTLRDGLVGMTSNAFAAFGGALVKGENAFAAFGKSILASMGQMLIQFGSMLVAIGVGLSTVPFLFGLQGPAAVAAGLAAIVLGGALTALGGGGGGASAPTTGGGTTPAITSPIEGPVGQLAELEEAQPTTQVAVNIQGNVLGDKRTLGREIADALNDAFGNDGIIIARGAIS